MYGPGSGHSRDRATASRAIRGVQFCLCRQSAPSDIEVSGIRVAAELIMLTQGRKQSTNPALASIIRDRRVQVLPVQWRALLAFEHEQSEEDQQHDMDNRFTMNDITLNKSIPYVRELTNSVCLLSACPTLRCLTCRSCLTSRSSCRHIESV